MSKLKLCKQAENLYIEEGMSIEDICRNLDISRRTIFYWKKKYDWDKSRNKKYKSESKLSTELTDIALKFMQQISKNMDNKIPTSQSEYYALINLIKNIPEVKKYEKSVEKDLIKPKLLSKSLTPEFIKQIQKDVLGWNENI